MKVLLGTIGGLLTIAALLIAFKQNRQWDAAAGILATVGMTLVALAFSA